MEKVDGVDAMNPGDMGCRGLQEAIPSALLFYHVPVAPQWSGSRVTCTMPQCTRPARTRAAA